MRRRHWWRWLLFEPGAGWLTWKGDHRERVCYDPPDFDQWTVYPPLRRVWFFLRSCFALPWLAVRGQIRWRESFPSWGDLDVLIDDDRRRGGALWR